MLPNVIGGLLLTATTTVCLGHGIPDTDRPFTRFHRLMLMLAIANTIGLCLITS